MTLGQVQLPSDVAGANAALDQKSSIRHSGRWRPEAALPVFDAKAAP